MERSRGTFLVKFSSPRPIPIRIDRPLTRSNSGGPRVGSGRGSSRKKRGWVWLAPTLGVLRQWQRGGRGAGGRPVLSPVVRGPFHQPRSARGLSSLALSTTLPIVVSFDHVYYHHTSKSNGFPANNRCGPLITAYLVNQGSAQFRSWNRRALVSPEISTPDQTIVYYFFLSNFSAFLTLL